MTLILARCRLFLAVSSPVTPCSRVDANLEYLSDFVYGSKQSSQRKTNRSETNESVSESTSSSPSDVRRNRLEDSDDPSLDDLPLLSSPYSPSRGQTMLSSLVTLSIPETRPGPQNPDLLSWLPAPYRRLLDHFATCMTRSISAHESVQNSYCRTLVPMALGTSHLLAAVLSLAATHRQSLGLEQSEAQLAHLKTASVQQLRYSLATPDAFAEDTELATTLVLCVSDIVSGSEKPGSWRAHLQGAAAILGRQKSAQSNSPENAETATFLRRWYLSFETLALLSGKPMLSSGSRTIMRLNREEIDDYIDDLSGFTTKLIPIYGEINLLAVERLSLQDALSCSGNRNEAISKVSELMQERGNRLVDEIKSLHSTNTPKFRSGFEDMISPEIREDYIALDETFHHVALLQVYRRILGYPSSDLEVQTSVKRVLTLLSGMTIKNRPCPGVAMLFPVFTAGCEACEIEDRDTVISLLNAIENLYGMSNVKRARELLKELWTRRDEDGDTAGYLRWDDVIGKALIPMNRFDSVGH